MTTVFPLRVPVYVHCPSGSVKVDGSPPCREKTR